MTGPALVDREAHAVPVYSVMERRVSSLLLVVGLGLLLGFAFWYGRGLWFYSDEWNVIAAHHAGNWTRGFNGQWLLVPTMVFWLLLRLFGVFEYLPFRVVGLGFYALAIVLFQRWAARRVRPMAATIAALAIAWYSTSKNVVMMPLLMNFTIPVAMLFAAWLLLDDERDRRDALASVCLVVAIVSSNVGLIVWFVVAVEFALRRVPRRRWLVLVAPMVVWIPWYVFCYESIGPRAKVLDAFHWGIGLTENYASGFTWGWAAGRWLWLGGLTVLLVWALVRGQWSPRAIAVFSGLVGFVVAGSFRFADYFIPTPPDPNWYLWLYSVLVMTLLVEIFRGRKILWPFLVFVGLVAAAGAFQLYGALGDFRANGVASKGNTRAWFAAADAVGEKAPDDAELRVNLVPLQMRDYRSLRAAYGSLVPGVTLAMLGDESTRETVDLWMLRYLEVPVVDGQAPQRSCRVTTTVAGWNGAAIPPGSVVQVTSGAVPTTVRLRRFGSNFSPRPFATIAAHHTAHFAIPLDHSAVPWTLYVDYTARTELCRR